MNPRKTWMWLAAAVALFGIIFLLQRFGHKPPAGPALILPGLKPAAVTSILVRPGPKEREIRAERTNHIWQLSEPLVYPAQAVSIERLLARLQRLTPATCITAAEIRTRPKADQEYGFNSPQASLIIQQGDYSMQVLVGNKTAPGDQVFLQVVGLQGAYVVGADLLQALPRSANDWRDTAVLHASDLLCDHITVTAGAKTLELERDATAWRIIKPIEARANSVRIEESIQLLLNLRALQFVSDDAKADLESFGLQSPDLELVLGRGTNAFACLQFGKSPTNDTRQVYARRRDVGAVLAVSADLVSPWRAPASEFRDPQLLNLTASVESIEVRGEESFVLRRQSTNGWRVLPQDFAADPALAKEFLGALSGLHIAEFVKDIVTDADLPAYGLASPARQYTLFGAAPAAPGATNLPLARVRFGLGTNCQDKVFAYRPDENSVYAISHSDFERLAAAGWQLRPRKIWPFTINDVSRLTIDQAGKARNLVRKGPHSWSLAAPSQGSIEDLAVEETVRALAQVEAAAWVGRGPQARARYGFTDQSLRLTLELKNGEKAAIEFGSEAPSGNRYAAVTSEDQLWIMEFPWHLYRDVALYLAIP
jgi:hypothetical protein